jgi:hypothetical protein
LGIVKGVGVPGALYLIDSTCPHLVRSVASQISAALIDGY